MFDLTVIICSHNPRPDYLRRVLKALADQTMPLEKWELLLVDNASERPLAASWDLSWHPHARHVLEEELGVTAARQRGIREASSDLIVFVDDDNLLDETYLARAVKLTEEWPILGAWGSGSITPEYELPPQENLKLLLPYLALRENASAYWTNMYPCEEATPWGAGMCVRAAVAKDYCRIYKESSILISSRRGHSFLSGEDIEIAFVACRLGLGMGTFPELKVTHLIPKERISPQYLLKLFEGTETSNALLRYKWRGMLPAPVFNLRSLLGALKRSVMRGGIDLQLYFAKIRSVHAAWRIIRSDQKKKAGRS
jgi:glycosyltransferase involved in cell wall biosynthesis